MNVKENFLKAIVLVMSAVMIFGATSMMFSAVEVGDNVPTTTAKPTTTAAPTTTKPTTTAAPTTTERTTQEGDIEYTTLVRPDRPTTTAKPNTTKAPTTARPATTARPGTASRPGTTSRNPGSVNTVPVVSTDAIDGTTFDEYTTDYTFDYEDDTTKSGYTFIDEDLDEDEDDEDEKDKKDKKDKSDFDFKKIIIIAVIVVAVVGAAVCLIILGKKQ